MNKMPFFRRTEKGQSAALFAIVATALVLFVIGVMEYMVTTSRMMEAVAVADLAAHAGAQEVKVLPNGVITPTGAGPAVARQYFALQAPEYVELTSVWCGVRNNRPACEVGARVRTAGYLLGRQYVDVSAVGYLAYGVTRGDQ
jgi:hypothetical protein